MALRCTVWVQNQPTKHSEPRACTKPSRRSDRNGRRESQSGHQPRNFRSLSVIDAGVQRYTGLAYPGAMEEIPQCDEALAERLSVGCLRGNTHADHFVCFLLNMGGHQRAPLTAEGGRSHKLHCTKNDRDELQLEMHYQVFSMVFGGIQFNSIPPNVLANH